MQKEWNQKFTFSLCSSLLMNGKHMISEFNHTIPIAIISYYEPGFYSASKWNGNKLQIVWITPLPAESKWIVLRSWQYKEFFWSQIETIYSDVNLDQKHSFCWTTIQTFFLQIPNGRTKCCEEFIPWIQIMLLSKINVSSVKPLIVESFDREEWEWQKQQDSESNPGSASQQHSLSRGAPA